jgi:hypothetical protein
MASHGRRGTAHAASAQRGTAADFGGVHGSTVTAHGKERGLTDEEAARCEAWQRTAVLGWFRRRRRATTSAGGFATASAATSSRGRQTS